MNKAVNIKKWKENKGKRKKTKEGKLLNSDLLNNNNEEDELYRKSPRKYERTHIKKELQALINTL